jgi:hypothetical protein
MEGGCVATVGQINPPSLRFGTREEKKINSNTNLLARHEKLPAGSINSKQRCTVVLWCLFRTLLVRERCVAAWAIGADSADAALGD